MHIINAKRCISPAEGSISSIPKELYIIKPQKYTLRVMIYAYGDDIHADAWFHTKPAAWIKTGNLNPLKKQGFSTLLHFIFNCNTRSCQHSANSAAEIAVFLKSLLVNAFC